ncbi:MAG: hypothetical protein L3K09_07355 [Thermoplasmata archaeon]|nr:hypothetical protein [Thermoplasmata archaeon]
MGELIQMPPVEIFEELIEFSSDDESLEVVSAGLDDYFNEWNTPRGPTSLLVAAIACDITRSGD